MKKAIILALVTLFALVLVGCADDGAPVGSTVRLNNPDGGQAEMYSPNPSSQLISTFEADTECEVLSGPSTVQDVTYWELSCSGGVDPILGEVFMVGWVDVAMIEVLD